MDTTESERKLDLNTKFRSAISHALLGADCNASRETWELVYSECEKIAKEYAKAKANGYE